MKCGKLVIDPRSREAEAEHQRRRDGAQGLVEIGCLLLGDMVAPIGGKGGQDIRINRIHIADHRHGPMPHFGGQIGAAIRRNQGGRVSQRFLEILRIHTAPTKERYCIG